MADFTDQDKELLDKLRKGFERDGKTRSELEPWQELLDRDATLNANRAAAAAKIVEGFAGSWAAQYKYGRGSTVFPTGSLTSEAVAGVDPQGPPVPIRAKESKLGKRGVPEINFVPYNWRTNTFGSKGPSLVGHPIGFEIVGPTLKSPHMDWTWQVQEGAGLGGGDLLVMDSMPDGSNNILQPYPATLESGYGPQIGSLPWTIGDSNEPNGGLYLVIAEDGANPGAIPPGRLPMVALDQFVDTARFELFRIAHIPVLAPGQPYQIHLHPSKRLSSFFNLTPVPVAPYAVRAITILAPYVTRLAAIPQSGASGGSDGISTSGREQTFVVVSPEQAASGDNFPPYNGTAAGDGTWLQGGFTEARAPGAGVVPGAPGAYGGRVGLPIPSPVRESLGQIDNGFALVTPTGEWTIFVNDSTIFTSGVFASDLPVINITATLRDDDLPALTIGTIENCLGWYDVTATSVGPDFITVNRVPETDPQTGLTYWGPGPFINNSFATREVAVYFTMHERVSALFQNEFDLDKVDAARMRNLIDPQWVGRFEKQISDPTLVSGGPPPPPGSSPGRPDRATFDTRSVISATLPYNDAENPGNLMDLGFRMVLFPAKEDAVGVAIPDFDNPITGRELVIDGSITEKQFLDIDYSSGILRLSHPPPTSRANVPDAPSDVIPNGIAGITTNNPRGEVVLFAACVPYSMEDSQLGTGVRLTTSPGEGVKDTDVYSDEVSAKIDLVNTVFVPTSPYIGVSGLTGFADIVLDRLWDGPETGVFEIQNGSGEGAAIGRFAYQETVTVAVAGEDVTALRGISANALAANPDPAPLPGDPTRFVVLRREAVFQRESFALPLLTDFAPSDTYYGSSARSETLRFQRARTQPELDGSTTIRPLPDLGWLDRRWGSITPSKLFYPIGDVTLATPVGNYFAEAGIWTGLDYQVTPGDPRAPKPGGVIVGTASGPAIPFDTDGGFGISFHGFVSTSSTSNVFTGDFQMRDNARFVGKLSTEYRNPAQAAKAFFGFVQDEGAAGPGLAPTVDFITQGPTGGPEPGLPTRYTVVGFFLDNSAGGTWRFWTRGSSGVENVLATPAVSDPTAFFNPAYYFVIEVQRYGPNASPSSSLVKLGIYTEDKQLLANIAVTQSDLLPAPAGRGLFFAGGVRRTATAAPGTMTLNVHGASIALEKDLGTFDLPPLP